MNTSRTTFSITKRIPGRPSSSQMHSDCPPEREETSPSSPGLISEQRSTSLTTIPTVAIQPRMAQLETLEAKMASIEVSLSNTPRRKKNGSITGSVTSSSIRSTSNKEVAVKELENLRNALKDKENIIQNLKGQLSATGLKLTSQIKTNGFRNVSIIKNHGDHENLDVDKKHIEERLNRLRNETDNKRLIIKKLKMALERLDITDNIDVRIQQAELEYQVGREELNLLTLLEEARTLQICLEESNKKMLSPEHTFYSCLNALDGSRSTTLHAIDLTYDPKSPNFGAGPKEKDGLGLWIDWSLDNTGLRKGDRLIEVNGKVILTKTREDLFRLLSADPNSAKIVVLRQDCYGSPSELIEKETGAAVKEISSLRSELEVVRERAEEAQRAKDGLRSDNIRLTHRISYLEEHVSELLSKITPQESDIRIITGNSNSSIKSQPVKSHHNITNINITAQSTSVAQANDLVFQKGPQVTALIQNINGNRRETGIQLPVRSKSSLSNVSNEQVLPVQKLQRHQQQRHHHHQKYRNNINNNSKLSNNDYESIPINNNNNSVMEQSYKKATKIVQDLTKKDNNQIINKPNNKHKPTCFESIPNSDILRHYNARKSTSVLDFRSSDSRSIETLENITLNAFAKRLYKKHDMRSVKSLDFDSDCTVNSSNQHVYDKPRPQPPKKPIRLSLHRAQSAQSMEGSIQGQEVSMRKPTKRNYKSEILAVNGSKDINQAWNSNKYVINKLDGGNGMCITAESASWC
nr:uncharacterized protein LOC111429241 [Onthophagus taurus]